MRNKNKLASRRLLAAFLIWMCLISVACVSIFAYTFLFVQPVYLGICDAGVSAKVWLDTNGNGIEEKEEQPFPEACLWVNSQYPKLDVDIHDNPICDDKWDYSDESGDWVSPLFSCGEDFIFVSSRPPEGYKSTTIPIVVSNGQDTKFGMALESATVSSEIKNLEFYVDYYQNERDTRASKNRFFVNGFILFSVIVSWIIAKRLVKPR